MTLAPPCFGSVVEESPDLKRLQCLSLNDKIHYSLAKIRQFHIAMNGKTYISFSGGKDSTVLLHLVRSIYPDTPAVFIDTGLEFPEIREHVKTVDNVTWLKPGTSFRQVIKTKGYPVISKEVSHWIDLAQRGMPSGLRQVQIDSRYGVKRWEDLVDAPFRVSRDCCDVLKKQPAKKYHKDTGRWPYVGLLAEESALRNRAFYDKGENDTEGNSPRSAPLMIWTDADIWEYIRRFNLPYCSIYDRGYSRTGCVFCMFGITIDNHRFLRLKASHPDLWEYCMRDLDRGGLGIKDVLDYIGIPTGCGQMNLIEFTEETE